MNSTEYKMSSRFSGLAVTVFMMANCGYCVAQGGYDANLIMILDSSLDAARGGNYRTMDFLSSAASESKDPGALYVALLDYYLGAGGGELLEELIIKEGQGILRRLDEKRKAPLDCMEKYREICTSSVDQRNELIDSLILEIKSSNEHENHDQNER